MGQSSNLVRGKSGTPSPIFQYIYIFIYIHVYIYIYIYNINIYIYIATWGPYSLFLGQSATPSPLNHQTQQFLLGVPKKTEKQYFQEASGNLR